MSMKPESGRLPATGPASGQSGFTVIELMIVVTIVSILAVIAMPAYVEYATRSKVSEAMGFMGEAKTSVSEYFYTNGYEWPDSNEKAGLPTADDYDAYDYILRLEVSSSTPPTGVITVTLDLPNTPADEKKLQLVPSTSTGEIVWVCKPADTDGVENKYAPANCRI
ncbi:prepilin-type N-terminal cleavage/methylation domain-containing protein [Seongchinamella sediminis]|uniref:Prepilin-type N-terminal cleavage/methylation domain-containing protein n=1 Tax=Seongchinamella sediminis TaxID=2283635 RepID=A0A3L7DVT6_9GAMM|nr:pilin [Seongchinamella sediminis]RLQ21677.1 prepilin-type N-terminal cleavage/methylation domain-containing protein [Seongchinamella sediminis]